MIARNDQFRGDPLISPGISATAVWCTILMITVALVATLFLSRVPRAVIGIGYLDSEGVGSDVKSISPGRIKTIKVKVGQWINKGDTIAILDHDLMSATLTRARNSTVDRQIKSLEINADNAEARSELLKSSVVAEITKTSSRIRSLQSRIALQSRLVATSRDSLTRIGALSSRGFVTRNEIDRRESDLIRSEQDVLALESELADAQSDLASLKSKLKQVKIDGTISKIDYEERAAQIISDHQSEDGSRQSWLIAPRSGYITRAPVSAGDVISANYVVASIAKNQNLNTIKAYVPASAIGVIRSGQRAEIKFDAVPSLSQTHVYGRVIRVSGLTLRDDLPLASIEPNQRNVICEILVDDARSKSLTEGIDRKFGMTAKVTVITGSQSLISLLLKNAN